MQSRYLNVIFTNHAISRLHNRGISQADVWKVIDQPDGSFPGKISGSRKFYKMLYSKKIEVVAKKNDKGEWVVLSCWVREPFKKSTGIVQKLLKLLFG